jgi:hypothetical protein
LIGTFGSGMLSRHHLGLGKWQSGHHTIARCLRCDVPLHRHARLLAIALVAGEEQDAVLQDRPAERSAELVELDLGLGRRRRQEWIARRERVALEVFKDRSVELVRSPNA